MKEFLELLEKDEALKQKVAKLDANVDSQISDYIALAAEYGVKLTEQDFVGPSQDQELSEAELDAVAGGKNCLCVVGGGGTGEESTKTKTCACVISGVGYTNDNGQRCFCLAGGSGSDVEI